LSQNFKTNDAHLIFEKDVRKRLKMVYIKVLSDLNMQKNFLNFINLHQILIIETLLVMELTGKEKMTIQITMFVWYCLKNTQV
jgi:hypothetical protein